MRRAGAAAERRYRLLFYTAVFAGLVISLPLSWLKQGEPVALLSGIPFLVLARFAWTRMRQREG